MTYCLLLTLENVLSCIKKEEVKEEIRKIKSGKAGGPSEVIRDIIKALGDTGVEWLTDICNSVIAEEKIPNECKQSFIVQIYKQKGDSLEYGNYRGTKLMEHAMKIFERVLDSRLGKMWI